MQATMLSQNETDILDTIIRRQGFARVLETISDLAHDRADEIRDAHHTSRTSLEADLQGSIRIVTLRSLADKLEAATSYAIAKLDGV